MSFSSFICNFSASLPCPSPPLTSACTHLPCSTDGIKLRVYDQNCKLYRPNATAYLELAPGTYNTL